MTTLVGVVGEFDPKNPRHRATEHSLRGSHGLCFSWIPTAEVGSSYDSVWIAIASEDSRGRV